MIAKFELSCPLITDTEKALDILVYKFLQPIDEFVRQNQIGGMMVTYNHSDPDKIRLFVRLFDDKPSQPFFVDHFGHEGRLSFRFYLDKKKTIRVKVDGIYGSEFMDERMKEFWKNHAYLPVNLDEHVIGWRKMCEYIIRFFQTLVDQAISIEQSLLDSMEQTRTLLNSRHLGADI